MAVGYDLPLPLLAPVFAPWARLFAGFRVRPAAMEHLLA